MSRTPVPAGTVHGVVIPPNKSGAAGSGVSNSDKPLSRQSGGLLPSNFGAGGDRRNGTVELGGTSSPIRPPNHRFDASMCKMAQPPSVIKPGRGAIPVSPWDVEGRPNWAIPESDIARQPRK